MTGRSQKLVSQVTPARREACGSQVCGYGPTVPQRWPRHLRRSRPGASARRRAVTPRRHLQQSRRYDKQPTLAPCGSRTVLVVMERRARGRWWRPYMRYERSPDTHKPSSMVFSHRTSPIARTDTSCGWPPHAARERTAGPATSTAGWPMGRRRDPALRHADRSNCTTVACSGSIRLRDSTPLAAPLFHRVFAQSNKTGSVDATFTSPVSNGSPRRWPKSRPAVVGLRAARIGRAATNTSRATKRRVLPLVLASARGVRDEF